MSQLVFRSIAQSNIPSSEKSQIRRWYERMTGGGVSLSRVKQHASEGLEAVRQGGESLLTGGALAIAHAELKTGLDVRGVPIDALLGGLGLAGRAAMAHMPGGVDSGNIGASAATVFAFRKTFDLIAQKKASKGQATGGAFGPAQQAKVAGEFEGDSSDDSDVGEDPIVAAARAL